jgi:vacuolar-type H+-ATPase subunit E/Vma4
MGLEIVRKRIEDDVAAQIAVIMQNASEEVARIERETQFENAQIRARIDQETEQILERMQSKEKLQTQLAIKKILLASRRDSIHDVLANTRRAIHEDPGRYARFLRAEGFIAATALNVDAVWCAVGESDFVRESVHGIIDARFMETATIHSGFIAENRERTLRFDATLSAVCDEIAHHHIEEVSSILWPESHTNDSSQSFDPDFGPGHPQEQNSTDMEASPLKPPEPPIEPDESANQPSNQPSPQNTLENPQDKSE